jgi:hypothetical protein
VFGCILVRALGSRLMMRDDREPVVRAMYSRKIFSPEAWLGDSSTLEKIKWFVGLFSVYP